MAKKGTKRPVGRPPLYPGAIWIRVPLDPPVIEALQAIAAAAPVRLHRNDMLRKATDDYVAAEIDAPAVQQALIAIRGDTSLRLVRKSEKPAQPESSA